MFPPPFLSQEHVATTVPYFAVVQSLHDAAKVAIMRRLELEAQWNEREAASPASASAASMAAPTAANRSGGTPLRRHPGGRSEDTTPTGSPNATSGTSTQQTEELRKAKQLADLYQTRTKELEVLRLEMEEDFSRVRRERDQEQQQRQRLAEENQRLRIELSSRGGVPRAASVERDPGRDPARMAPGSARPGSRPQAPGVHRMASSEQIGTRGKQTKPASSQEPATPRSAAQAAEANGGVILSKRLLHSSAPDLRAGLLRLGPTLGPGSPSGTGDRPSAKPQPPGARQAGAGSRKPGAVQTPRERHPYNIS